MPIPAPIADTAAARFHARLRQLDPGIRHPFVLTDLCEQALGHALTAETRAAWAAASGLVAGVRWRAGRRAPPVVADGAPGSALRPPADTPIARSLSLGAAPV